MPVIVPRARSWLFAARNASLARNAVVQRSGPRPAAALAVPLAAAVLAGVPAASAAGGGAVSAVPGAPAAGVWGRAVKVPGLAALSTGGQAEVASVSCASAGSCAAGGYFIGTDGEQGFVVREKGGRWGRAVEVPGLAALNAGRLARVLSVSCGAAGSCAAGGYYTDRHFDGQGFVAVERDGVWGRAAEVPALAALNTGGDAEVLSVSCGSAGSCAAGGYYSDARGGSGFVAVERNGVWGRAVEVPGLAALNTGRDAQVVSVSCASAGNCAAGGYYLSGHDRGFVVSERHGGWGRAIEVPGLGALNKKWDAGVDSVSCASPGNCATAGHYTAHQHLEVFVADERNGLWGKAIKVPGLAALNTGGFAIANSVSCASPGTCAAGGLYSDRRENDQGFVAVERHGRWRQAIEVPGLGALNKGGDAEVNAVSCASPGNCAAGGDYGDRHHLGQGFVAVERNGRWRQVIEVPGLGALNKGGAGVKSVSCAPAGTCAAGGYYTDRRDHSQGFVVSQTG